MNKVNIKIENSWKNILKNEFEKEYFKKLADFVRKEYINSKIYPPPKDLFRAFSLCPFSKVKVIILGQDPYHGIGQANGLCFAVNNVITIPPSLKNIFKEIRSDLEIETKESGDLSRWAEQGILLLNSVLTVKADNPGSHQNKGWELFTDEVINKLSNEKESLVFMLWGNYAKNKGKLIDKKKHLVLESVHPSPFSANDGFFGCKHFSKANEYLRNKGFEEINWK